MANFLNRSVSQSLANIRVASTLAHFQPQTAAVSPPPPPPSLSIPKTTFPVKVFSPPVPLYQQQLQQQQLQQQPPPQTRSWNIVRFHSDLRQALAYVPQSSTLPRTVKQPDQILVRVLASSVSPQDLAMARGLGSVFNILSQSTFGSGGGFSRFSDRLPLTPGRDFVGTIVARGQAVSQFKPGDLVWGTVPPGENGGAHADYVIATESSVAHKPRNLSNLEAASLPYIGLTAWAAINTFGELTAQSAYKKKVLILGGSGGVGCFAVQLLKYWGAEVTTTCSAGAIDWLKALTAGGGVTECIDYRNTESFLEAYQGTFDFILDASSSGSAQQNYQILAAHHSQNQERVSKGEPPQVLHSKTMYVTLNSPLIGNLETGNEGLGIPGSTIADAINDTLSGVQQNGGGSLPFRWAYTLPNPKALLHIGDLVERGAIRPLTTLVYEFDRALEAYQALVERQGRSPGRIVLSNETNV